MKNDVKIVVIYLPISQTNTSIRLTNDSYLKNKKKECNWLFLILISYYLFKKLRHVTID